MAQAVLRIDPHDEEALPALIKLLQEEHNGTGAPEEALAVLESLGPAAAPAIPAIRKALQDKDSYIPSVVKEISEDEENYDIRGAAAKALAAVAGKEAVPVLIERMKWERSMGDKRHASDKGYSENDTVCAAIAAALGKLGADAARAVPLLVEILADSQVFSSNKWDVIESLGAMGPAAKDSVPQLIKVFDDEDTDLHERAAVALGRIGPAAKAAVPRLLELSTSDPDEDIREAARAAVQRIAPEVLPSMRKRELRRAGRG